MPYLPVGQKELKLSQKLPEKVAVPDVLNALTTLLDERVGGSPQSSYHAKPEWIP